MARPEEKAMSMLNKWTSMKSEHDSGGPVQTRRPHLSSLVSTLHEAQKWRRQIIGEISRDVAAIQNRGLPDSQIRDINDNINKLIRTKYHWNKRVKELGGPDFNKIEKDSEVGGEEGLRGSDGYRYFGAARDLPGVKELFARRAEQMNLKRGDVYKAVNTEYYGFADEEDGVLLEVEGEAEEEIMDEVRRKRTKVLGEDDPDAWADPDVTSGADPGEDKEGMVGVFGGIIADVPLPSRGLMEKAVLDAKKKELLDKL